METTSESARQACADYRATLDLDDGAEARILRRLEASIADGEAEKFVTTLEKAREPKRSRPGGRRLIAAAAAAAVLVVGWGTVQAAVRLRAAAEVEDAAEPWLAKASRSAHEKQVQEQRARGGSHTSPSVPVIVPSAELPEEAEPEPQVRTAPKSLPATPETHKPEEEVARAGSDLKAEFALIRAARKALKEGRLDDAAKAVERHRLAFPTGQLRLERESIAAELE